MASDKCALGGRFSSGWVVKLVLQHMCLSKPQPSKATDGRFKLRPEHAAICTGVRQNWRPDSPNSRAGTKFGESRCKTGIVRFDDSESAIGGPERRGWKHDVVGRNSG